MNSMNRWNIPTEAMRVVGARWKRPLGSVTLVATVLVLAAIFGLHPGTANADTTVWSAEMTVGINEQNTFDQLGFLDIPDELDAGFWDDTGSLDNTTFTHAGVAYTVSAIYYPDFSGDHQYLFLHLDHPLPEGLSFEAGGVKREIADATALGWSQSLYMWELDTSPGWAAGSTQAVFLTAQDLE